MKKILFSILLSVAVFGVKAQTKKPATKPVAKTVAKPVAKPTTPAKLTLTDSASYAFGMAMASSLKSTGLNTLNYELVVKGLKETFNGGTTMFSQDQAQASIQNAIAAAAKSKFEPNIAEGKAFLENNKKQAGVKVTASGLQYLVLTDATGSKPGPTDSVTVHYRGTLINGMEFDSSISRGEPITFALNRVISGWTEAVQLMSPGAKYRFFIPYNLAYGERGAGADIPPFSTLIFDIELLKFTKP